MRSRQSRFVVEREIPEIGARVGDRLVLRPWAPRACVLQHDVVPTWAFAPGLRLIFTRPRLPHLLALRFLEEGVKTAVDGHAPALGAHLTLVP